MPSNSPNISIPSFVDGNVLDFICIKVSPTIIPVERGICLTVSLINQPRTVDLPVPRDASILILGILSFLLDRTAAACIRFNSIFLVGIDKYCAVLFNIFFLFFVF